MEQQQSVAVKSGRSGQSQMFPWARKAIPKFLKYPSAFYKQRCLELVALQMEPAYNELEAIEASILDDLEYIYYALNKLEPNRAKLTAQTVNQEIRNLLFVQWCSLALDQSPAHMLTLRYLACYRTVSEHARRPLFHNTALYMYTLALDVRTPVFHHFPT